MGREFYVEQTLHGYSNGHRLLQASFELSEQDNKKMLRLSDISGNDFFDGFERYFTGYSLDDNRIVLACTWYAAEMQRPGCVWTHSLVFNVKDLFFCVKCVDFLINFFKKPESNFELESYSHTLKLKCCNESDLDKDNLKYLIWCLWGNSNPLVVFEESSRNLEKEIIYLFLTQHDLLEPSFSFCTGSFSLREYSGNVLKFQIAPNKVSRSKLYIGKKAYEAKDREVIKSYPLWVNKIYDNLSKDGLSDFRKFIEGFSKEYKQLKYISAFVKLYVGSNADVHDANLIRLLEMAFAIFDTKKDICNQIIELYCHKYFVKWCGKESIIKTLLFFIDHSELDNSLLDLETLVKEAYFSEFSDSKSLFKKLVKSDESLLTERLLKCYSDVVTVGQLSKFTDLEYESCSTLISIRNEFAMCQDIWKQNRGYQQGIIRCLKKTQVELDHIIIETVLKNSSFDLAYDLYKVYGDECLQPFWEYLLSNRECDKIKGLIDIVRKDNESGINQILCNMKEREKLLFLLGIVDSYDNAVKKLRKEDILHIYQSVVKKECLAKEKELLARFLLPLCIIEDYLVDVEIAKYAFKIVDHMLATQTFPENEWEKLEKILPEVAYYNNWDRCKRLRKGFKKKGYSFGTKNEKNDLPSHLL